MNCGPAGSELLITGIASGAGGIYVAGFVYSATSNGQASVRKFDRNGNQLWTRGFDNGVAIPGGTLCSPFGCCTG